MRELSKSFFLGLICVSNLLIWNCAPNQSKKEKGTVQVAAEIPSILENIQKNRILRIGTTGDYSPFSYQLDHTTNTFQGMDIELAKDLAKSLGVQVEFVKTSWPNLMSDLKSNRFDIAMSGITITPERQKEASFSIPVISSGKAVITRDENVEHFDTMEEINSSGVRVIINPGGTNEKFALENFPNATLVRNKDNISIFQEIVAGNADVMVTDAIETLVQEQIHPELEAVNYDTPFNSFDLAYLFQKDEKFKVYVDNWLLEKKGDRTLRKILNVELAKFSTATKP